MIRTVKLFVNDNEKSEEVASIIRDKMLSQGFVFDEENYDLAIAVGGDGAFLRMVKSANFNSDVCYVGVNVGTLGFLQEVRSDEIDLFIDELKNDAYKIDEIGIQETRINYDRESSFCYSLNEIVIRDRDLNVVKLDVFIENDLLEKYTGDGLLISTSVGSTAYNLSYGGSVVYNTFATLQITSMAPINSKSYRSFVNSIIVPEQKEIRLVTRTTKNSLIISVDGENLVYDNVSSIKTIINGKKIKVLRLKNYSFAQKLKEKLLND